MNKNVIGIISAILAIVGLVFVSSWMCLFPLGAAFTLAVIGLFGGKGKDKTTPFIGMLVSVAGIVIMCQFAGFIPTFGFKPIGIAMKGIFSSSGDANTEIKSREDALAYVNEATGGALDELNEELKAAGLENGLDGYETDSSQLADGGRSQTSDGIDWSMKTDSNTDAGNESVVGAWKYLMEGHVAVVTFDNGGTGTMQIESYSSDLAWEQRGKNLQIDYMDERGIIAETEEFGIEFEGNKLRLVKPDGSVWIMERME